MSPETTLLQPDAKDDHPSVTVDPHVDIHAAGSVRDYIPHWDPDVIC